MPALTCADVRELTPELALDVLGGVERAAVLDHISRCAPCRSFLAELSQAAEALPRLAPEAEPPPGFEQRVLASVRGGGRRRFPRWAAVVAATAAAASIVSVVVVRIVDRGRDEPAVPNAAVSFVRSVPMVGVDGRDVGWAFVSNGRPAAVGVSVAYWVPSGVYTIEYREDEGRSPQRLGRLQVQDGRGTWAGTADLSDPPDGSLALVDADGTVVCEARLGR